MSAGHAIAVAEPTADGLAEPQADELVAAHAAKREAVLDLLDRRGLEELTLTSQPALAWYLEGARVGVNRAADPVLAVRIDREADRLLVFENEAERILDEEVRIPVDVVRIPWFETIPRSGSTDTDAGIAADLRGLRRRLAPHEVRAFRSFGRDAARAVTAACREVTPATTERELAGVIAQGLESVGAEVLVVLVGGESRRAHRHPLPTEAPLGRRALVVVCARRAGLVANLSRWVGELDEADLDLERRIAAVEADALAATVPGERLDRILVAIAESYPRHGFDADEWRRHHQGGPTGFNGRDPRASPQASDTVVAGQAFAWNPTATGAKVEDTMLRGEGEGAGAFEVLTRDEDWPTIVVEGRERPTTLTPR